MYFLLNMGIFHCYVSHPNGAWPWYFWSILPVSPGENQGFWSSGVGDKPPIICYCKSFFCLGHFQCRDMDVFFPANKQLRERWKAVRLWRVLRSKVHNSKNQNRQVPWYCWCTKSCTTKDDDYLTIHRVLTIPGGAGFRPWTVVPPLRSIKWVKTPPFLW